MKPGARSTGEGGCRAAAAQRAEGSFARLLASSIHDMKNSIGLLLSSVDELAQADGLGERTAIVQGQARRVYHQLMQLLTLYKMDSRALALNAAEHAVAEFLEDCLLRDRPFLEARSIVAQVECDPGLYWSFDRELVAGVLANAIDNATRHARSRLVLAARAQDGLLRLAVNDDGEGFPAATIAAGASPSHVDFGTGRTGLGLSFAAAVADLHRARGRTGRVELTNGGVLGGACFALCLP